MTLLIRVLGSPAVDEPKRPLTALQSRLLGLLVCERSGVVHPDVLADRLWLGFPPKTSASALRMHITKVRDALEDRTVISTEPGRGYSFRSDLVTLDCDVFVEAAATVDMCRRSGDHETAVAEADEALRLWRGAPYSGCDDQLNVAAERARLDAVRADITLDRLASMLIIGRVREGLPELRALAAKCPGDERVAGLLMTTLAGIGATADALQVFDTTERWLQREFGAPPSPAREQTAASIARRSAPRRVLQSVDAGASVA